ncbi:GNAT family N-acetyltransferase [Enhygromyxa salina]|uniref:Protease synthase and sporulation negative regulatory protein n=1 Tax=Enhygromyxa salina TaxID=215803 RepID=A0A2S9Y616_9BACT|nr:GNAT family N-acetyltransferase [Enhygromyxa salina]PRQ00496.1 Protease synthase and sporulation negative regulatory protein [Enhygromyxa salina]
MPIATLTEVRQLCSSDYDAYLARVDELDAVHRDALPGIFRARESGRPRTLEYFEALLADPNTLMIGAWVEAELAGYAHAILREVEHLGIHVGRRYVLIDNFAVGPRWQRRGVGRALVDAVADWAKQRGATDLELEVWEVNAGAIRFYEEIGFEPQRRRLARSLA